MPSQDVKDVEQPGIIVVKKDLKALKRCRVERAIAIGAYCPEGGSNVQILIPINRRYCVRHGALSLSAFASTPKTTKYPLARARSAVRIDTTSGIACQSWFLGTLQKPK